MQKVQEVSTRVFFKCAWICSDDFAGRMKILQHFSMHASSIFYVYQKFRMHAWMQHGKRSGRFGWGR